MGQELEQSAVATFGHSMSERTYVHIYRLWVCHQSVIGRVVRCCRLDTQEENGLMRFVLLELLGLSTRVFEGFTVRRK